MVIRDAGSGPPGPDVIEHWAARARTLLAEAVAKGLSPAEALRRCEAGIQDFGTGDPGSGDDTGQAGTGLRSARVAESRS